jgi:adenylate cyclase
MGEKIIYFCIHNLHGTMSGTSISESEIKNAWYTYLTTGDMPASVNVMWFEHKVFRPIIKRLPKSPRCRICYLPFEGLGGLVFRKMYGIEASKLNPHLCNLCERFANKYRGGAELEIAVMFVDIRNSTAMAEKISAEEFSKKVNSFYSAVTNVFYRNYGMVEKFQGDEVGGFFVPGFTGPNYKKRALKAAREALQALGYNSSDNPWIEAGVGIHSGIAYVGSVTTHSGISDVSILGDTVNIASRLASHASGGEIIISEEIRKGAGISADTTESRRLVLKGKSSEMDAWVIKS